MARIDPHNVTRYWRPALLPGLTCLHADFRRHDYAPHMHDAMVIAVTEDGGAEFKSRGETGEARAERLLVFNPVEPHSGRMGRSRRWLYRSLYLDGEAIASLTAALGREAVPYFTTNVFDDRALIAQFLALLQALDSGQDRLLQSERLIATCGALFQRYGSTGRQIPEAPHSPHLAARVIDEMRARHGESLTLEELGQAVSLTPFQLIGLIKKATGLTPHAYLTQIRLQAAKAALEAGQKIAEAALTAGFYDQAALTNHFKRAFGITPFQYVKAHAA
jgi:AraC-like DNA-binding protein